MEVQGGGLEVGVRPLYDPLRKPHVPCARTGLALYSACTRPVRALYARVGRTVVVGLEGFGRFEWCVALRLSPPVNASSYALRVCANACSLYACTAQACTNACACTACACSTTHAWTRKRDT